jgi:hypothetical protein
MKHAYENFQKTPKKHLKPIEKDTQYPDKTITTYV